MYDLDSTIYENYSFAPSFRPRKGAIIDLILIYFQDFPQWNQLFQNIFDGHLGLVRIYLMWRYQRSMSQQFFVLFVITALIDSTFYQVHLVISRYFMSH